MFENNILVELKGKCICYYKLGHSDENKMVYKKTNPYSKGEFHWRSDL